MLHVFQENIKLNTYLKTFYFPIYFYLLQIVLTYIYCLLILQLI